MPLCEHKILGLSDYISPKSYKKLKESPFRKKLKINKSFEVYKGIQSPFRLFWMRS